MSKLFIHWRAEDDSLFGYVRFQSGSEAEFRAFEIRHSDQNCYSVFTVKDGAEIGAVWQSITIAKRLALNRLYETLAASLGEQ